MQIVMMPGRFGCKLDFRVWYQASFIFKNICALSTEEVPQKLLSLRLGCLIYGSKKFDNRASGSYGCKSNYME